jgi:hypothetical protein
MTDYSALTDGYDVLTTAAIQTLTDEGYTYDPLTSSFSQYLATALTGIGGSSVSHLRMSMPELLAGLVNELGSGPVTHLDTTVVQLLALLGSPGGSVVVPAAPALTWNSLETDDEPDFLVDLPNGNVDPIQDAAADDHLIIEYQLQAGGAWTEYVDYVLLSGDITDDTITVTGVGSVANGDYFFRARLERGALIGTDSANEAVTINVVATNLIELESSTDLIELESSTDLIELESA